MGNVRFVFHGATRRALLKKLSEAQTNGILSSVKKIMAILAMETSSSQKTVSNLLKVSEESVRLWFNAFLLEGLQSISPKSHPGRPPRLTKTQRKELTAVIIKGPQSVGFSGACWRSPMIQTFILNQYGVFYSVHYISQLLKNMGFSYQKAKFVSDHKDPKARENWIKEEWPHILKLANKKNAMILFGDEASFPQWGSLSYTWAKRGKQPIVKTSGNRKGYKVFGLIEYFSGKFFAKGHEGKLNAQSYCAFLKEVLSKTRKHLILIQDGAPYHRGKVMNAFFEKYKNRISAFRLPTYSPDYNPIEKLWKKIKEKEIHLHFFPTFEDLKIKVKEALIHFKNLKEEVLSLFGFYKKVRT